MTAIACILAVAVTPPPRPSHRQERIANWIFLTLSPRLPKRPAQPVPGQLAPFERVMVPRVGRPGRLSATLFPARGARRGAVVFVAPWLEWGQGYFFRRGRIAAVRAAGYDAVTFDLGGFGQSDAPAGFADRDVEDMMGAVRERAAGSPVHLWGVSAGGYWSQPVLARAAAPLGAMFEDVAPHIFDWSVRMRPPVRPAQFLFRTLLTDAHRYFDMHLHLPAARALATAYVSGARDRGILPAETRALAELTGGEHLVVADAGHLDAIKRAPEAIIDLALRTFSKAEAKAPAP